MIYFVRDGIWNEDGSSIKVGYSTDCETRLKALQTGNPKELEVCYTLPGGEDIESCLHDYFKDYHLRGEWFNYIQEFACKLEDLSFAAADFNRSYGDGPLFNSYLMCWLNEWSGKQIEMVYLD